MRNTAIALSLLAATCSVPGAAPGQSQTGPVDPSLGVTTHFSQGWPTRLMDTASGLGTNAIRDSLHWAAVETVRGNYAFTDTNSGHITRACSAGMKVLLGIDPRNKIYDDGFSANSVEAQQAFANYLAAIAARYRGCVIAIEIGNEINGKNNVTGPAASNRVAWYIALLKAVRPPVKAANPDLAIVGGSTNTIAAGFHERLYAAGMLPLVDGVAVHPYRTDPETVDWELARLVAAMQRHGTPKPVWSTEFSRDFVKPADAPPFLLKMAMLQQSAGVHRQFWYALIDQKWFPTMGLLTLSGGPKPAGDAFAFVTKTLAPAGPARRIDLGAPDLFHFRIGNRFDVIWGTPRAVTAVGAARAWRADGTATALPAVVSAEPVVIEAAERIDFGPAEVLADSLYGFGQAPLNWLARRVDNGTEYPLSPIDWQWTTYLSSTKARAVKVTQGGMGPAAGISAVASYAARDPGVLHASVCLAPLGTTGDGTLAELRHNSRTVWSAATGPLTGPRSGRAAVTVQPGDRIEFVLSPGATAGGDRMKYRFRVSRTPSHPAEC